MALRLEGVTEFVEHDRSEEADGAGDGEQIRLGGAGRLVEHIAVEVRKPEDDQEQDEEPGPVHGDPDTPDAKKRECAATAEHEYIVLEAGRRSPDFGRDILPA